MSLAKKKKKNNLVYVHNVLKHLKVTNYLCLRLLNCFKYAVHGFSFFGQTWNRGRQIPFETWKTILDLYKENGTYAIGRIINKSPSRRTYDRLFEMYSTKIGTLLESLWRIDKSGLHLQKIRWWTWLVLG